MDGDRFDRRAERIYFDQLTASFGAQSGVKLDWSPDRMTVNRGSDRLALDSLLYGSSKLSLEAQ